MLEFGTVLNNYRKLDLALGHKPVNIAYKEGGDCAKKMDG